MRGVCIHINSRNTAVMDLELFGLSLGGLENDPDVQCQHGTDENIPRSPENKLLLYSTEGDSIGTYLRQRQR